MFLVIKSRGKIKIFVHFFLFFYFFFSSFLKFRTFFSRFFTDFHHVLTIFPAFLLVILVSVSSSPRAVLFPHVFFFFFLSPPVSSFQADLFRIAYLLSRFACYSWYSNVISTRLFVSPRSRRIFPPDSTIPSSSSFLTGFLVKFSVSIIIRVTKNISHFLFSSFFFEKPICLRRFANSFRTILVIIAITKL